MLAGKIFTDDPLALITPVLNLCDEYSSEYGVELAMYGSREFDEAVLERVKALPANRKSLHSWHARIGLDEVAVGDPGAITCLEDEAAKAKALGIKRYVIHGTTHSHKGLLPHDPTAAANRWAAALERIRALGLRSMWEKTDESLPWMRAVFAEWARMGLASAAGFCLDTGHVRVWEKAGLPAWSQFMRALAETGFGLHYHVHANAGDTDSHIALHLAEEQGLLDPTSDWAPEGFFVWLGREMVLHPDAMFVLENPSEVARDAFIFTRFVLEDRMKVRAAARREERPAIKSPSPPGRSARNR